MTEKGCYYCKLRKGWSCEGWNSKDIRNEFTNMTHYKKLTELLKGYEGRKNNVGCDCSKFVPTLIKERVIFT